MLTRCRVRPIPSPPLRLPSTRHSLWTPSTCRRAAAGAQGRATPPTPETKEEKKGETTLDTGAGGVFSLDASFGLMAAASASGSP